MRGILESIFAVILGVLAALSILAFMLWTILTVFELKDDVPNGNYISYFDGDGARQYIDIPNDAHYGGYMWQENRLVITFTEG